MRLPVLKVVPWALLAAALTGCPSARQSLPSPDGGSKAGSGGVGGTGGAAAGSGGVAGAGGDVAGADGAAGSGGAAGTTGGPDGAAAAGGIDGGSSDTPQSPDAAANGATCTFDTDCRFGHCAEGVCCESACATKCMSCSNANTGQADGKCAPVKVGIPHASDCTATDPATCGLDGKCDGAGACRYFAAGSACAAESCSDGASTSTYTPPRSCNGTGTCMPATTTNCGGTYRCTGTKCKTTCAGATDCASIAYCAGTSCSAKKADGAVCSAAAECTTGVCGGRCCAAGCTCTLPSSANVLTNAGFDSTDISSWTAVAWTSNGAVSLGPGALSRSTSDAEQCPYSGSLLANLPAGSDPVYLDLCIKNHPFVGNFNFGGRSNTASIDSGSVGLLQVNFYSGFNCDGDLVVQNETDTTTSLSFSWQELTATWGIQVSGANSVDFRVYTGETTTATTVRLDMLYLSPVPTTY